MIIDILQQKVVIKMSINYQSIVKRKSCRAIMLTKTNDILLIKIENPDAAWVGWITPGGGMSSGENEESALRRELYEELGIEDLKNCKKIWTRFHSFPYEGKIVEQEEVFYLIHTDFFEPKPTLNSDDPELLLLKEFRWWSLNEIKNTSDNFAPSNLYSHLCHLIKHGKPTTSIDVGI